MINRRSGSDAADPLLVAVPPGVFVHTDGDEAVVAGRLVCQLPMISFHQPQFAAEIARHHQPAHVVILARHQTVARQVGALFLRREHRHKAPDWPDLDQPVGRIEPKLAADQVEADI